MGLRFNLVIWGTHQWDDPTAGRARYLAECVAKLYDNINVIYVNPPIQHKFPLRHCSFWRVWLKSKKAPIINRDGVTILNVAPSPLPYSHHFHPFRLLRGSFIGSQIQRFLDNTLSVLVITDPKEWPLARWWKVKHNFVVYDCMDLMPAFQNAGDRIAYEERNLISYTSLITCSARGLIDHLRSLVSTQPIVLVRNGVHYERFQGKFLVPECLQSIPRPRIGFIGSISYWVDIDLIATIAYRNPQWHFVLIGPVRVFLPALPNIHLLPPISPTEIAPYLHGLDVGLVPFRDMPLIRCVNPLKLYEYLACGKPVVATPYGDFEDVQEWVYFAQTPEEFTKKIACALSEDNPSLQEYRRRAARQASWQERSQTFVKAIYQLIEGSSLSHFANTTH